MNDRDLSRAANQAMKKVHAKRNLALIYVSFDLGLWAKGLAALKLKHELDANQMLLDEINFNGSMIEGRKQGHVCRTNSKVAAALEDYINEPPEEDGSMLNLEAPLL